VHVSCCFLNTGSGLVLQHPRREVSERAHFLKNIHECEWFTRRADTDNAGESSIRGVECNDMEQVQNLALGKWNRLLA
jgi:hypothetical protein